MPSSKQEVLRAYRQSFSLIDQDILRSISRTRPHTVRKNKSSVCAFQASIYTGIQDSIPKHFSLISINKRKAALTVSCFPNEEM